MPPKRVGRYIIKHLDFVGAVLTNSIVLVFNAFLNVGIPAWRRPVIYLFYYTTFL